MNGIYRTYRLINYPWLPIDNSKSFFSVNDSALFGEGSHLGTEYDANFYKIISKNIIIIINIKL